MTPHTESAVDCQPRVTRAAATPLSPLELGLPVAIAGRVAAYVELSKPRVTTLILVVAAASFWLASDGVLELSRLASLTIGVVLLASGIFTLNQFMERDLDAKMRRTDMRPLPTGRLSPAEALTFGLVASAAAIWWLAAAVNALCGLLAVGTLASYLFLYTVLKTRTPHSTLLGAFPGAAPPLFGWAAATGELSAGAWVLFGVLFLWQFPHFHSIGWLYREDYARAGIRLWPVIAPEGSVTRWQIVLPAALLVPVSLLPGVVGMSGTIYGIGAVILGSVFLHRSVASVQRVSKIEARRLLVASVVYLPLLFAVMVLDRW